MTTFDNHTPINFDNAETAASARRDGGAYSGIGYNSYKVYHGARWHLVHFASSGCECRTDHISEHLGVYDSRDALVAALLQRDPSWWVNELLGDLDYEGEPA